MNPRKAYPVDPGLVPLFDRSGRANTGHALKTAVLIELERRGAAVTYVRTPEDHEVDFLARSATGEMELVQVSSNPTDGLTAERELRALEEAGRLFPKAGRPLLTLTLDGVPSDVPPGMVAAGVRVDAHGTRGHPQCSTSLAGITCNRRFKQRWIGWSGREFARLVDDQLPSRLQPVVHELLRRKLAGDELSSGPRISAINDFLDSEVTGLRDALATIPRVAAPDRDALDRVFRDVLGEVWDEDLARRESPEARGGAPRRAHRPLKPGPRPGGR